MRRGKQLLLNTILLTGVSFLMRTVGMVFQVYLSNSIGAAGIGLFQLVASVDTLAVTLAVSSVRFAATRLIAEELGEHGGGGITKAVSQCIIYALSFGFLAAILMFSFSEPIAAGWIRDERTVLSLKILAVRLPALSAASVFAGYFTAVGRVYKSVTAQILEQIVRIGTTVFLLTYFSPDNIELSCAMTVAGSTVGEFSSLIISAALYFFDIRRYERKHVSGKFLGRVLKIALPLAASTGARRILVTIQDLMIPQGFRKSGASSEQALADYGMMQGMVFPVITFPSALFYSLAELLVPELTDAQVTGRKESASAIVNRTLRLSVIFSFFAMSVLYFYSEPLGLCIYDSEQVGAYISAMAFLMPVMYLDSITDGMLRGLGQHLWSMKLNIVDAFVSVFLVWLLLPSYAVKGYIFILYFSEIFNFSFSLIRLSKIVDLKISIKNTVISALCSVGAANAAMILMRITDTPLSANGMSIFTHICAAAVIYAFMVCLTGCFEKKDFKWIRGLFSK